MAMDYTAAAKAALTAMVEGEPAALPSTPGPIALPLRARPDTFGPGQELDLPQRLGELRSVARDSEAEPAVRRRPNSMPRGGMSWNAERIALAQRIWGKGLVAPGGAEAILNLVRPLKLRRRMRVLELGAGLGAAGRLLARKKGVHVTGLESNAQLAEVGMALSTKAWLAKRAPVRYLGGSNLKTPLRSYDCFLARNFLFSGADRAWMLDVIGAILNDHGELLITDFVLPKPGECSPAIQTWLAAEPQTPIPWATADYANSLASNGLQVRIDDLTKATCRAIRRGWASYLARLEASGQDRPINRLLVEEAEFWARRVELLQNGELSVCRIHAAKALPAAPPLT